LEETETLIRKILLALIVALGIGAWLPATRPATERVGSGVVLAYMTVSTGVLTWYWDTYITPALDHALHLHPSPNAPSGKQRQD
jgi:hypothetical protein